jgi:hypothetical protein
MQIFPPEEDLYRVLRLVKTGISPRSKWRKGDDREILAHATMPSVETWDHNRFVAADSSHFAKSSTEVAGLRRIWPLLGLPASSRCVRWRRFDPDSHSVTGLDIV